MDSTNKQSFYNYGNLEEKETFFKLNSKQKSRWDQMRQYNTFIRNEHHNIHQLMWKPGALNIFSVNDDDDYDTDKSLSHQVQLYGFRGNRADSCRFYGNIVVNKVSGNFHISSGKYIPLPIGHAHVSMIGNERGIHSFTRHSNNFIYLLSTKMIFYASFFSYQFFTSNRKTFLW